MKQPTGRSLRLRRDLARHGAAAGIAAAVFLVLMLFGPFGGVGRTILAAAVAIPSGALVLALPRMADARRGSLIDDSLPLFITHFGVLATTNLPRNDLLRVLAENQEYAAIAAEMRRILRLTTEWGLSLGDAVRATAETTPSQLFSAFLLRMAHALEAGQTLENFLMGEQAVVMQDYASLYQANLLKVDNWKEMYTNAIMTIGFLSVFAAVLPLLGGGDMLVLTFAVAAAAVVLEVLLGLLLKERLPRDRLSPHRSIKGPEERRLRLAFIGAGALGAAVGAVLFLVWGLGPALLGLAVPFFVPGLMAARHEKAIRRRETDYPAFIRSVGAAAAARGGAIRDVLGSVQANKLGELTTSVRALHRRLSWGIDDAGSWRRFGEETGSRLIDSFTTMFVQGIASGGKPGAISQILSDNMLRILNLRTSRRATAGAFRGMLFGLAGGLALVLFLGAGIFSHLTTMFGSHADLLSQQGLLQAPQPGASEVSQQVLFFVVALHGAAAGVFYKQVEGGRLEGAALHSSLQVIVGIVAGLLVLQAVPKFLGMG